MRSVDVRVQFADRSSQMVCRFLEDDHDTGRRGRDMQT